ncbi:MAG: hypothetical protein RDV41_02090 [Planctomycetota bacterium]|nr:hypothetical protein [Planctomycetota bacterium]
MRIFALVFVALALSLHAEDPAGPGKEPDKEPPAMPDSLVNLEKTFYFAPVEGLRDLEIKLSGGAFAEIKAKMPGFSAKFFWKAPDKVRVQVQGIPEKSNVDSVTLEERLAKELVNAIVKRPVTEQADNFESVDEEKTDAGTRVRLVHKDKKQSVVETGYVIGADNALCGMWAVLQNTKTGELEKYEGKVETIDMRGKRLLKRALLTSGDKKYMSVEYEYTEVDGFVLPTRFIQAAAVGAQERTFELVLSEHKVNQSLDDSIFQPAASDGKDDAPKEDGEEKPK